MPIHVIAQKKMMNCECGHSISLNDFEERCRAEAVGHEMFVGLLEDAECPECGEQMEEA